MEFIGLATCDGCPAAKIIGGDLERVYDQSYSDDELPTVTDLIVNHSMNLMSLHEAAVKIDCRNQPKDIPEAPNPMPPIGHPDRIAYGRHCLAYLELKRMNGQE